MRTRLVLKIQKNIRANLTRVKLKEEFKKIHKRKKILKELKVAQEVRSDGDRQNESEGDEQTVR